MRRFTSTKATVEIVDAGRKENTRTAQLGIAANHRIGKYLVQLKARGRAMPGKMVGTLVASPRRTRVACDPM